MHSITFLACREFPNNTHGTNRRLEAHENHNISMKKHIIGSIVLSILAPTLLYMVVPVTAWLEALVSSILWKMKWSPYYLPSLSTETIFVIVYILQTACYVAIIYCLYKLYASYKAGAISFRTLVYPAILGVLSVSVPLLQIYVMATSGIL